jgi:hypothetical protein
VDDFSARFDAFLRMGALLAAGLVADDGEEQREIADEHLHFLLTGETEQPGRKQVRQTACDYTKAAFAAIKANRKPQAKR